MVVDQFEVPRQQIISDLAGKHRLGHRRAPAGTIPSFPPGQDAGEVPNALQGSAGAWGSPSTRS